MQHNLILKPVKPMAAPLRLGRFTLTLCADSPDSPAQALRARCFRAGATDRDDLDPLCRHAAITDPDGQTVAAFRLMVLHGDAITTGSYSSRFYDLSRLAALDGPALELGRFCLHPDWHDPDILRLAWAALTRIADAENVALLFGCSSFSGTDPALHADALAHLARHHLAPAVLAPQRKAASFDLATAPAPDPKRALAAMPPLLRTYLAMGGWVSDHAVIDRDLDTFHVFTGVEIAHIPPARARLLRALAGSVTDSAIDLPALSD